MVGGAFGIPHLPHLSVSHCLIYLLQFVSFGTGTLAYANNSREEYAQSETALYVGMLTIWQANETFPSQSPQSI